MLFQKVSLLVCLALLTFLFAKMSGAAPLSPLQRGEDPRLEKRITLSSPRISIGELLENLSTQTGVTLQATDEDAAAGVRVAVYLRDVPLATAMNALWSLVSYRQATWNWERAGEAGKWEYRLQQPRSARSLGDRLRREVEEDFEAQAATLLAALKMTPEQRKQLDEEAARLIAGGRLRAGLTTFAQTLPLETQQRVIRGQEVVTTPSAELGAAGQEFVRVETERKRKLNPGVSISDPSLVRFFRSRVGIEITPTLWIMMGTRQAAPAIGGTMLTMEGGGYVGGTRYENRWRQKIRDRWLLDEDAATDAAASASVAAPPKREPDLDPGSRQVLSARLGQLARAVPLSLMARLPADDSTQDPGVLPYGQTVQAYLDKLAARAAQHKWREGILLIGHANWFWDDTPDQMPPWSVVKSLRQLRESDEQSLFSLETLADTAQKLSAAQLKQLGQEEFPVMEQAARWRDLLAMFARDPKMRARLRAGEGIRIVGPTLIAALRSSPELNVDEHLKSAAALPATHAPRLYLVEEEIVTQVREKDVATRSTSFLVRSSKGKTLAGHGFLQQGRPLPAKEKVAASRSVPERE